jgi:Ras-related protein Rab-6A
MGKTISHKGNNCRIQLWDTAGQEKYKSLIPSYLQDADCVLYIFDVSSIANIM